MSKLYRYIILAVLLIVAGVALWFAFSKKPQPVIEISEGRVASLESMVQLCAVEVYNEVPVLDTINNKVIFAVQKQRGSVSFDIENFEADAEGDTVRFVLPREIVEVYESTDDNSWEVIDTKPIGKLAFLKSGKLSDQEENAVKKRLQSRAVNLLYSNGTVARARKEAVVNLRRLMEKVYRKPVVVVDTIPQGMR